MNNISGFGTVLNLVASSSFPSGFTITQFTDDTDPIDIAPMDLGDTAMGVNGDLIVWNKATAIKVTLSVIPDSDDDINLGILAENNRVGKGKISARDEITLTKISPDGRHTTFSNGILTNAPIGTSIAGSGRAKTKVYTFAFENKTGS